MSFLAVLISFYVAQIVDQYNAQIDSLVDHTQVQDFQFNRTHERIDKQFFNNKSAWKQSRAQDHTALKNLLIQAGYSGDLEGLMAVLEYDIQHFNWVETDKNVQNLLRAEIKALHTLPGFHEAYFYEEDGDIDRLYFIGEYNIHRVYYETESTFFSVMYAPVTVD